MARHTRKGRNPGPVDEWLDTLGYYRKNVAYDETCLFRAVSEQMFACQLFHETIRKRCIIYARNNHADFKKIMPNLKDWSIYLERLAKHMAVCGSTEIQIISRTYKKGILLFDGLNRCMKDVTNGSYSDYLLLCHMGEDHYDVVYKRDYIQDAGFCQSIVYNVLYENVFEIPKVNSIVQAMLYQKPQFAVNSTDYASDEPNNNNVVDLIKPDPDCEEVKSLMLPRLVIQELDDEDKPLNDYEYMLKTNIAPFPFKVAKALDPTIYRNIEYDTWTEMRKEMRLGDWYYGDNNLIQGSGCIFRENGEEFHCYIQEILKNDNKCVVYITSRAEKRVVKLCELQPEADAKPWPLPYRFSKNLVLSIPKLDAPDRKALRKKRDKKRTTSKCSNDSESQPDNADGGVMSVYLGAPLQVQSELPVYEQEHEHDQVEQQTQMYSYADCSGWDDAGAVPHTPDQVVWPHTPTTTPNVFTFNTKPVLPTTPGIYTTDQRYYYADAYPRYSVWTNGEYVAPLPPQDQTVPPSPHGMEMPSPSPDNFSFIFSDSSYSPSCYTTPERAYPVAQPSPQIEMYQPMYPAPPPGTPVILAPTDMTELMLPTPPPHVVYSPAIEMPYIQTSPYIYPPTPPAAWYPPTINSQGFIFPTIASPGNAPTH